MLTYLQYYVIMVLLKNQVAKLKRLKIMKKILTTFLILSIITVQFGVVPLSAAAKTFSRGGKEKITAETKYSYVNIDWWKNFNDELLTGYINKALENNHDLKIADIATEEYFQAMKLQFSQELPQAGAGFAPVNYKLPYSNTYDWHFFLPVAVNYEADIFLKNHDKTQSAKKLYEMSLLDEKAAYISVVSGIGTVYLNIVKLNKVIEIQNQIVQNRKTIYNLMQKRNIKGLTSQSDVVAAEKSYTAAFTELSDLEKEKELLLNQLAVMIGESPYNTPEFKISDYDNINFSGNIPAEISTDIITSRPDYMKAEKEVEKAGLDVRIARKEFLPSFNIAGLALFNAANFGSTLSTANSLLALGAGVFEPVFTGGARIANLKLKKAGYERILENYKKTNLIAMQEINDSLVSVKKDDDKLQKTLQQKKLSEKEYFLNQKRYEKGAISYLDLLQSQEVLLAAEKLVTIQQIDNYINYIGLYKACGGKI